MAIEFSGSYDGILRSRDGIPRRVGFADSNFAWLLTDPVAKVGPSSVANNLLLLRPLGSRRQSKTMSG